MPISPELLADLKARAVERLAKDIYEGPMIWAVDHALGAEGHRVWIDGGNSLAQSAARKYARTLLAEIERRDQGGVEPVGVTGEMPGSNGGFSMAVFRTSDVPVGAPLYAAPPASAPGEVVEDMRRVLAGIIACHDDAKKTTLNGLIDCIDNKRVIYQSKQLADLLEKAALSQPPQAGTGDALIEDLRHVYNQMTPSGLERMDSDGAAFIIDRAINFIAALSAGTVENDESGLWRDHDRRHQAALSSTQPSVGRISVEDIRDLILKHAMTRSGEKVTPREAVTTAQAIYDALLTPAATDGGE